MNEYKESKKKLDVIRDKYGCKGELIFRTAIQYVIEYGQHNFLDEAWYGKLINGIDARHDVADKNGTFLFCTRDFEKALFECAREMSQIDPYNLLMYVQKEVWLGGNGISYQRAIELLKNCMESIYSAHYEDCAEALDDLYSHDFNSEEIEELGYGFLLDVEEEEYE